MKKISQTGELWQIAVFKVNCNLVLTGAKYRLDYVEHSDRIRQIAPFSLVKGAGLDWFHWFDSIG